MLSGIEYMPVIAGTDVTYGKGREEWSTSHVKLPSYVKLSCKTTILCKTITTMNTSLG